MKIFKKNEIAFLVKPLSIVAVLILLILTVTIVGISEVSKMIAKNSDLQKTDLAMSQKIAILQRVTEEIAEDTTFLDVVVPSKSSALYALNQVNNLAFKNTLVVSDVSTSQTLPETNDLSKTLVKFVVTGEKNAVYSFATSLVSILPIINIETFSLSTTPTLDTSAEITFKVYSAELPKNIPSLASVPNELTADEIKILQSLSSYTLPSFVEPDSGSINIKEDPFN